MELQKKEILFAVMCMALAHTSLYLLLHHFLIPIVDHSRFYLKSVEVYTIMKVIQKFHYKFFYLQEALNNAVKKDIKNNNENVQDFILAIERVERQTVFGYTGEKKFLFLKITVALPRLIAPCKRLLETEIIYPALDHKYTAFESNIDFDIRFVYTELEISIYICKAYIVIIYI